jgi:hypothetical protein
VTVKSLLLWVALLLTLAFAADRVSLNLSQRAVATQLKVSGSLSTKPSVTVHGFPFLTQAFHGRYDDVDVTATDVTAGGGRLSRLDVNLRGVHVPLGDALAGSVSTVPVDRLRATVLLSYDDMAAQLRDRRLAVSPAGDQVRVTGSVTVLGRTVTASAISSVALSGEDIVVTAKRFEVGNAAADRAVSAALGNRFDFVIRVGQLPYGLQISSLRVEPAGVVATADARNTVLHSTT